jgi:hypothetical protein
MKIEQLNNIEDIRRFLDNYYLSSEKNCSNQIILLVSVLKQVNYEPDFEVSLPVL